MNDISKNKGQINNTLSVRRKKLFVFILILLCGVVSAVLLSFNKLSFSYKWDNEDNVIDLSKYDQIVDNVELDWDSGRYSPINDDPWILFRGIDNQYKGILITLKEPVNENVEVKMYWTHMGDDALSESRTRTVFIDKGEKSAYLRLPGYAVGMIRVDIDAKCQLESIEVSNNSCEKSIRIRTEFVVAFLIRLALIVCILYVAYLAHLERVSKGSPVVKGLFFDEIRPGRSYEYDYIRTLAALLVIMMHSVIENFAPTVAKGDAGYLILKLVLAFSLVCNALYIMLSGALLLKPSKETIGEFYKKRLPKVLIPTISYYMLYMIQGFGSEVFKDGLLNGLWLILKGLLTSRPEYMLHMWFIYAILSLYIFAPFLRIIVANISHGQLFGLVVAGFVFDVFATVLPMNGLSFGIDTPIASWMGVFLLGYYMTTDHAKNKQVLFMILGVIALGVTCVLVYNRPDLLYYESNWAPLMWIEGAGVFAFFIYFKKIFGKHNPIIAAISKFNFSIMLVHVLLLMKFILPIGWRMEGEYGHLRIFIIGIILVCFVMSFLVSVIYDNTVIIAMNYLYRRLTEIKDRKKNR